VGGLGSPVGFTRGWGGEYVFEHERVLEWVLLERVGGSTCRGSGGEVGGWKLWTRNGEIIECPAVTCSLTPEGRRWAAS